MTRREAFCDYINRLPIPTRRAKMIDLRELGGFSEWSLSRFMNGQKSIDDIARDKIIDILDENIFENCVGIR